MGYFPLRKVLFLAFLFLVTGCLRVPVETSYVPGFQKIPLNIAVILSPRVEDWRGSNSIGNKIKLPLKCHATNPRTFRVLPGGKREWIRYPNYTLYVFTLQKQAKETFRRNLPMFFSNVDILETPPSNKPAYDLILYPTVTRWPMSNDPPDRVVVQYNLKFYTPAGTILLDRTVKGITEIEIPGLDLQRVAECYDYHYMELERTYLRALALSQVNAIKAFLNRQDNINQLRSYAKTVRAYAKVEKEKKARPSDLVAEARFDDTHALISNNRLDAGEEAALIVKIKNQGCGAGYGVVLTVITDNLSIIIPTTKVFGEIPPGQTREVRLPVKAGLDITSGKVPILIEPKRNGVTTPKR